VYREALNAEVVIEGNEDNLNQIGDSFEELPWKEWNSDLSLN